jgi:hypothetical protein
LDVSLSRDCSICDDKAGPVFDGFLKTTMLGVRTVGVSEGVSWFFRGL